MTRAPKAALAAMTALTFAAPAFAHPLVSKELRARAVVEFKAEIAAFAAVGNAQPRDPHPVYRCVGHHAPVPDIDGASAAVSCSGGGFTATFSVVEGHLLFDGNLQGPGVGV